MWKLTSGSDLIEEYGLTFNDINVEYDNSVLVFLPDEPTSDFLITEMKIENGNLYLTVEEYVNNNNLYLKKQDVKFYLLNGIDIGALNESFKVNVKVEAVNIPLVPVVEIPTNVDVTDAILIAQEHFFHTFAIELPKGYIYTAKLTKETEKYWQITVFDKGMNEQYSGFCTDEYVYSIHKTSGEILEIKIVDRTPITKEEAIDVAKNYFHKHYQQKFDDNAEYYATDDMYDDSWMVTVISEKVRFVILVDELTAEITDIIFEQTEE